MGLIDKAKGKFGVLHDRPTMKPGLSMPQRGATLMARWEALPPELKEEIAYHVHKGIAHWQSLPPEKKEHIKAHLRMAIAHWRALPEEKRMMIKRRMAEYLQR